MALPLRLAAVSLIMPGLFGTLALPAYAALPDDAPFIPWGLHGAWSPANGDHSHAAEKI